MGCFNHQSWSREGVWILRACWRQQWPIRSNRFDLNVSDEKVGQIEKNITPPCCLRLGMDSEMQRAQQHTIKMESGRWSSGKPDKIDAQREQLQYQKKKLPSHCGCTNQATPSRQSCIESTVFGLLRVAFSDPRVSNQKFCPRFSGTRDQID